jgi:hypothetical protein
MIDCYRTYEFNKYGITISLGVYGGMWTTPRFILISNTKNRWWELSFEILNLYLTIEFWKKDPPKTDYRTI